MYACGCIRRQRAVHDIHAYTWQTSARENLGCAKIANRAAEMYHNPFLARRQNALPTSRRPNRRTRVLRSARRPCDKTYYLHRTRRAFTYGTYPRVYAAFINKHVRLDSRFGLSDAKTSLPDGAKALHTYAVIIAFDARF